MKINFNTMPKMQGFGGNCIGKTLKKNRKETVTQRVSQAVNNRTKQNHNVEEQFELINVPSNQVLPKQNLPIEDTEDRFVTIRSKYSGNDSLSAIKVEDISSISNNNVDKMTEIVNKIAGNDLEKQMKIVDKLETTEEKKHDILMNGMIQCHFNFIDTITQLPKEENFKRKLDYIDEAFQDKETRKEKHAKFVEAYNSDISSKIENETKDNGFVNYHDEQEDKKNDLNSLTIVDLNETEKYSTNAPVESANVSMISTHTLETIDESEEYLEPDTPSEEDEGHFAVEDYPQNYDEEDLEIFKNSGNKHKKQIIL